MQSTPRDVQHTLKNFIEFNIDIFGFHYTIIQWIWVGVNLSCIDGYAVLDWANDMKLHVFATKHKAITYHEHLI